MQKEKRGGAREGAGRKLKSASGKAVTITFCCSPKQKETLAHNVEESGLSRSEYITKKLELWEQVRKPCVKQRTS